MGDNEISEILFKQLFQIESSESEIERSRKFLSLSSNNGDLSSHVKGPRIEGTKSFSSRERDADCATLDEHEERVFENREPAQQLNPTFQPVVIGIINETGRTRLNRFPCRCWRVSTSCSRNKSSFVGGYLRHGERFAPWFTGQSWWTRSRTMSGDRTREREKDRGGEGTVEKRREEEVDAKTERGKRRSERERKETFFLVAAAEEENEGPPGTEGQGARRMSCCAHRGVDPRPLGRSYAVVSVPLSHGHVYIRVLTAFKLQLYIEKMSLRCFVFV